MSGFALFASLEFAKGSQLNACIAMLKAMAEVTEAKLTTSTVYLDAEHVTMPIPETSENTMSMSSEDLSLGGTFTGKKD